MVEEQARPSGRRCRRRPGLERQWRRRRWKRGQHSSGVAREEPCPFFAPERGRESSSISESNPVTGSSRRWEFREEARETASQGARFPRGKLGDSSEAGAGAVHGLPVGVSETSRGRCGVPGSHGLYASCLGGTPLPCMRPAESWCAWWIHEAPSEEVQRPTARSRSCSPRPEWCTSHARDTAQRWMKCQ